MFHHSYIGLRRSKTLAFAGTVALAISPPLWSASCVGPAPLEARIHSHPDAGAYEALGIWFGENRKSDCAAQAFQAGLKLEPNSPRLPYLLGLSLYTAGRPSHSRRILASARAAATMPARWANGTATAGW